ncbi:MAG TPA: signal peptidase I [Ktedonobacterales bacterium]
MARRVDDEAEVGGAVGVEREPGPERAQQSQKQLAAPPSWRHDLEALSSDPHVIARQQALLREITTTLLITLALFIGLHSSAQAVPLDGPSMQPGLHTDERVLVNSLAYTFRGPQRGDVIVFRPPSAPTERYIKRVIGLPGDTITLTPDQVIVNGVTLDEPYITAAPPGESENPEPQTFKLSETQYFVMGDNRTNSEDSRFFGPITQHAIIGKAEFVVWPITSFHSIDTYPSVFYQVPDARIFPSAPLAWLALAHTGG